MLRVLLTNDDGIGATGLQTLRRALLEVEEIELVTIAPDANMSATARSITTRQPLWVTEVPFDDGTRGFSCDGTPVDCVRLASLGLVEDFEPDLVVAGINHGSNLGDDITYSGTVAAALEGIVLGVPALAVSQQSQAREMDFRLGDEFDFETAASFTAKVVDRLDDVPLPEGTLLNINVPAGPNRGFRVTVQAKRNHVTSVSERMDPRQRPYYWIEEGLNQWEPHDRSDYQAVRDGYISITPLQPDMTAHDALGYVEALPLTDQPVAS